MPINLLGPLGDPAKLQTLVDAAEDKALAQLHVTAIQAVSELVDAVRTMLDGYTVTITVKRAEPPK